MADKPLQYPDFALNDELDPITLAPNKVEPTEEFKLSGQKRRQPFPRPYLNWQFWNIGAWIRWFEEQLAGSPAATLQSAFPVGTVHLSTNAANPASYLGFGTWTAIAQGRALFGVNTGDPDFNTVKETGGGKTHTHGGGVTGGTALTLAQMPSHSHNLVFDTYSETGTVADHIASGGSSLDLSDNTLTTEAQGSGATHNHTISSASNLPPYITLFVWERTA